MEFLVVSSLSSGANTYISKMIVLIVDGTDGLLTIVAVILIVGHVVIVGQLASEVVVASYAYVDESFALIDKVFAEEIASIGNDTVSIAIELAVGVLHGVRDTL